MKDYRLKFAIVLVCISVFIILLGIAGRMDYTDHVILRMSYDEYDSIKKHLMEENGNKEPSDGEIVSWWEKHHE